MHLSFSFLKKSLSSFIRTFLTCSMSNAKRRKRKRATNEEEGCISKTVKHTLHSYTEIEAKYFQKNLLVWFEQNKRDLPWRQRAKEGSLTERVYSVLVSEIMLQQTQVNTVIAYYKKWMTRWPSFDALAKATAEEVNEMWSGLGYYARGKRLQECAKEMCKEKITLPCSAVELQTSLPGVGRYTASAVASIVFGEKVAAVDGNVIRVLARHRVIGADSTSNNVVNEIWNIANTLIDPKEPGKFNEAMMELGAVVCTPKGPKCNECPVKNSCLAYRSSQARGSSQFSLGKEKEIPDIESVPDCILCLPVDKQIDETLGVLNYPRKAKKVPPRKQESIVWILQNLNYGGDMKYFMVKRPDKGLLGNLWEFPCYIIPSEKQDTNEKYAKNILQEQHGIKESDLESIKLLGSVFHVFSHIHQTYVVFEGTLKDMKAPLTSVQYEAQQWLSKYQIKTAAVSTAMKKVFSLLDASCDKSKKDTKKTKSEKDKTVKNNKAITSFFSMKSRNTQI